MTTLKLLRISECANRLNCSRRHVYYLIESAQLAALSIGTNGKGLRVPEGCLNEFIKKRLEINNEKAGFCE